MVTPLNDSSGSGFFGKGFWGRKVFWLNVPSQWRHMDSERGDYFQKLLMTWGDAGEDLVGHISLLSDQRDPYKVRTRSTWTRWFYVTDSFLYDDSDRGTVIRLIGEKELSNMPETDESNPPSSNEDILDEQFPWFPYEPLSDVGRYWQLYWNDAQYEVVNVRARNYDQPYASDGVTPIYDSNSIANEIWVKGGDLTLLFNYFSQRDWSKNIEDDGDTLLGTVTIGTTDGSQRPILSFPNEPIRLTPNVNSSSNLVSDSRVIIRIPLEGGGERLLYDKPDAVDENIGTLRADNGSGYLDTPEWGNINYLSGEISIDMSIGSEFSSETGLPIKAKYIVRGYYMLFNAPPMIDYLAKDFGFNNDHNDPEAVQRSTIANITKFWGIKSAHKSYEIRGAISLFDVDMQRLYRICSSDLIDSIPTDRVIEINGVFYTDVRPIFIRFDHISSDEQFYDYDDGIFPQWVSVMDNMLMATDYDRWDQMTIGQAYAIDVTQGYYGQVGETPLNTNLRGPAIIKEFPASGPASGVETLTDTELDDLGWENGFRYTIEMLRCQFESFNFQKNDSGIQSPELFALSVYDYNANPSLGTPPGVDDTYYYIDKEEQEWTLTSSGASYQEDVGEWIVLVRFGTGVSSPISVNDDIAVRYLPVFDTINCCYCPSNKMRAMVEVTDEAYDFYNTYDKVENATERLKTKILELVPIHARIGRWSITKKFEDYMFGAQNGGTVEHELTGEQFVLNSQVLLTIQFRGDNDSVGKEMDFRLESESEGVVWQELNWSSGVSDNDTWIDVVVDQEVTLPDELYKVYTRCISGPSSTYGDVRWIFTITSEENE
jgi:hypothetical protein